jgi:DUF1680 family protein
MMETCVTTTWMKLCDNLLRLTGDPGFADEMERSAYNALLSAAVPDGSSFAKVRRWSSSVSTTPPQPAEICQSGSAKTN